MRGVGYQKSDIVTLPISGFTGANMKDRLTSDVCTWYQGPSLIDLLDSMELDRDYNGPLMMPIADKTRDMGMVIMGKIESGICKKGQSVMLMPNKKVCEVLAIMQEDCEVPQAFTGDNVRIRLKGIEEEDVSAGFVMCGTKKPVHAVTRFEAQLVIMDYPSIMCGGYTAVLHAHTATEEVHLVTLLHKIDKKTGRKSKAPPQFVKQGDSCIALLETSRALCLERYTDHPQLGRFTLRDEGKTVAIGKTTRLLLDEDEE